MNKPRGIVAAGHEVTAQAAARILDEGGNAFDAIIAALFTSCVAEPVLASLGGGGFLQAVSLDGSSIIYDFFAHTPQNRPPRDAIDLYPITADFGTAQQDFHIGMGAIATPGMMRGVATIHKERCSLPLALLIEPACEAARSGISVNSFQHYISTVVAPILKSSPDALALHTSPSRPGVLAEQNDLLFYHDMADSFEALAAEGEALFFEGEMGQRLIDACKHHGGNLTRNDLTDYRLKRRKPLRLNYHDNLLLTNPAPSVGGTLIAFTLALLEAENLGQYDHGSIEHLQRIAHAQKLTQQLRREHAIDHHLDTKTSESLLIGEHLQRYRQIMSQHTIFSRGTTQISIADSMGNLASMTLSNGEGSGYVIPGTGIMMNNMLGEEDINPHGFHQWPKNSRIASMMAPTIAITADGRSIITGSGGSNRIRSAILQVLINLLDFNLDIQQSVESSRLHYESNLLNIEYGYSNDVLNNINTEYPNLRQWPDHNLFFGGAHTVVRNGDGSLIGCGDARRGGISILV